MLKGCPTLHKCCCDWGYHNCHLYPDKFSNREEDAFCVTEFDTASSIDKPGSSNADNLNSTAPGEGTLHSADTIQSFNNVNAHVTQIFLAPGERVLLQTTPVTIFGKVELSPGCYYIR